MNETKPNIPLLTETLVTIAANPSEWDQANWRCPTGMCYAGHAVSIHGMKWVDVPNGLHQDYVYDDKGEYVYDSVEKRMAAYKATVVKDRINDWMHELDAMGVTALRRIERIAQEAAEQAENLRDNPERYKRASTAAAAAQRVLGLTNRQAGALFAAGNGMGELTRYVSQIASGEDVG